MAGYYQAPSVSATDYLGLSSVFGYVNPDGRFSGTNCGLAASCTLLTFLGKMPVAGTNIPNANPNMTALESTYPPNILGGLAGTSRGRVERILETYGTEAVQVEGEEALRQSLKAGTPVAVMLQVPGQSFWGITFPAGHWMVAYGCDEKNVYLTNWDIHGMPWEDFRRGWSHFIPWCIDMDRKGLRASLNS